MSDQTIIEGEVEEVAPPSMMPVYPPQVKALTAALVAGGTEFMRGLRRDPDTGNWWAVVERTGGGFLIYGLYDGADPVLLFSAETFPEAERALENIATGRPVDAAGPPPAPPPPGLYADDPAARLAYEKERAKARIDAEAELARAKYMTTGAGQAMEYLATESEAQQALAVPEGTVLPAGMFLFLDAEVTARGGSLRDAALRVMQAAGQWRHVGGLIKTVRLTAKEAINHATDLDGVRAALQVTWP